MGIGLLILSERYNGLKDRGSLQGRCLERKGMIKRKAEEHGNNRDHRSHG